MSRNGMRGFDSLRTRPVHDPRQPVRKHGRRCEECGAVLRDTNEGRFCAPHQPDYVPPVLWSELVAHPDVEEYQVENVAKLLRDEAYETDTDRSDN